jgi:hypothetical protein
MLSRILDAIDEAAGGFIRLTYLAAGITAVALYFGAGHLAPVLENGLNAALPWALAAAVETHSYLSARRVRVAWQDHNAAALKVNLAILTGLMLFSAWNQLGYLAATWSPPTSGVLALPGPLAYLVRALVVPMAFVCAAFIAPMAPPITAQLETEARATLADVFRIARKQRRRLLRDAQRSGRDMTAALVELVPDPDARRVIQHAYAAIGAPVTGLDTGASRRPNLRAPRLPFLQRHRRAQTRRRSRPQVRAHRRVLRSVGSQAAYDVRPCCGLRHPRRQNSGSARCCATSPPSAFASSHHVLTCLIPQRRSMRVWCGSKPAAPCSSALQVDW